MNKSIPFISSENWGQADARLARFVALYPRLFAAQAVIDPSIPSAGAPSDLPAASIAPAAQMTPDMVDLRYPDGFAVRMPNGASPFKPSAT